MSKVMFILEIMLGFFLYETDTFLYYVSRSRPLNLYWPEVKKILLLRFALYYKFLPKTDILADLNKYINQSINNIIYTLLIF